jgi:hypothetical protein
LPGDMSPGRQLQRLETRMAQKYEVRTGFVSVQSELLEAAPEPLVFDLGQILIHRHPLYPMIPDGRREIAQAYYFGHSPFK